MLPNCAQYRFYVRIHRLRCNDSVFLGEYDDELTLASIAAIAALDRFIEPEVEAVACLFVGAVSAGIHHVGVVMLASRRLYPFFGQQTLAT